MKKSVWMITFTHRDPGDHKTVVGASAKEARDAAARVSAVFPKAFTCSTLPYVRHGHPLMLDVIEATP